MTSPFKFLDPYGPEDIKAFFGRARETEELFSLVTKNRLTFVYGPSGTGKTSLVRCGLANCFDGVDWLPLFIRRGEDINVSLREAIGKALGQETAYEGELATALQTLFKKYFRTVYLIFDQFEELFILGDRDDQVERLPFYQTIADLVDQDISCRILFIMREDYFGHLDHFERLIPELYHRKLRVEPMSREKLQQVIVGSCEVYNISFSNPKKDPERILDNIIRERAPVQMPFVQVYLHKLYLRAAETQKTIVKRSEGVRFDQIVIDQMGPIEKVLGYFLEDQEKKILDELAELDPPENLVRRVLDIFVSEDGTKKPVTFQQDNDSAFSLQGKAAGRLALFDKQLVGTCIQALERNRILRRGEDQLEVAHDTLAALIDQQRTNEQRQLNEIRRRIEIGYREHLDSKGEHFFDAGQLARIEPFIEQIAITPEWRNFLELSRKDIIAKEQVRVQKELDLTKSKLRIEQQVRHRKKQLRLFRLMTAIALLALVASIFAFRLNIKAIQKENEAKLQGQLAEKERDKAQAVLDMIYFYEGEFGLAHDIQNGRYGFIDKDLNTKIEFKYTEASPFDYTGFARVKRDNQNFLIDTTGMEYLLANNLEKLDVEFESLDLRNRNLKRFPLLIFEHRSLEVLLLSQNQLISISSSIGQLESLRSLDLNYNKLIALPAEIGQLFNLNSLDLWDNQLANLPAEIGQLSNLRKLDLGFNQLYQLPVEIGELSNLNYLSLNHNQLIVLPPEIGQLSSLSNLYLSSNQLSALPPEIGQLSNLSDFYLSSNQLNALPPEISQLSNLSNLYLSSNQLSALPPEIGELQNLTRLDMSFNRLNNLPVEIGRLSNLNWLDLSDNQLSSISVNMDQLENLSWLDLSYNQLRELPAALLEMNSLQRLVLEGNPIPEEKIRTLRQFMPWCKITF